MSNLWRVKALSKIALQTGLVANPASVTGNQLGGAFTNGQHSQHGVDAGHVREDTGIGDTDTLEAADLQCGVDNGHGIAAHISHLGGTGRVVHGVGHTTAVLGQLLVGLHLGTRGDLALDPLLEGRLLGDLTGGLETGHNGGGVVALGIGEVAEVQGGLDGGVGGGQEETTTGTGAGNVGGHAEGVHDLVVAETSSVEGEGDLVAMHHHIGDLAVEAGGVGQLATEEDSGIRVHGGLVLGNGAVELPYDDTLGVVEQVLTDTGEIFHDGDAESGQVLAGTQTGEHHQTGSVDGSSAQNGLLLGAEGALLSRLQSDVDTGHGVTLNVDLGNPSVGKDSQVRTLLVTTENRVNVGDGGTASAAIVGVVGDVEEANTLGQFTGVADVVVEVLNDGNVHSTGASLDPVLAKLVTVTGVHGLNGVAQVINDTGEGLKVPALAALGHPVAAIILEGTERDESVVAGATTQDLCARVADMAVTWEKSASIAKPKGFVLPMGCSVVP